MTTKDWIIIVSIILLSSAAQLLIVKKFLIPEVKTVDLVSLLEEERAANIKAVLDGKMTQEQFAENVKNTGTKIDKFISAEKGLVLVKQCVVGNNTQEITTSLKASLAK